MIIDNFEVLPPDDLLEVKIRCFNSEKEETITVFNDITGIPFHAILMECERLAMEWANKNDNLLV